MPWKEVRPMDAKISMLSDWKSGDYTKVELSENYGISRKTVYKWLERYEQSGVEGLKDRSRAPQNHPNQISEKVLDLIIDSKISHPQWGPKKLIAHLSGKEHDLELPCASTVQVWLKRNGLVKIRKPRKSVPPHTQPFAACSESNNSWSIDFKGQFKTGNGIYCYPLTVIDNYSRYLLMCRGLLSPNYPDTEKWLRWLFQEYGLPEVIRSDNGEPFAVASVTGLSRLGIWWIQLGIKHERIAKGHPEQNGRLERFHRTLKEETAKHPKYDLLRQQMEFERFRDEYNSERPHEALGQILPADIYQGSMRKYPARINKPEYDINFKVRKVKNSGEISLDWKSYYVCQLLKGEYIGVNETDIGSLEIYYYDQIIAIFDIESGKVFSHQRKLDWQRVKQRQALFHPPSLRYDGWKKSQHTLIVPCQNQALS